MVLSEDMTYLDWAEVWQGLSGKDLCEVGCEGKWGERKRVGRRECE